MSLATVLIWLGIVIGFILINALFVAAEYSMVRLRRSRVQELVDDGNRQAKIVQYLQRNMGTTIAGTQLGITLASLALGWVGQNAIHQALDYFLGLIPGMEHLSAPVGSSYILCFICLSMTHVILGEQVPKSLALRIPERVALLLAKPVRGFCFAVWPMLWVMSTLAGLVLKLLGIVEVPGDQIPVHSADEFEILFDASRKAGTLDKTETDLLKRALELNDLSAKQIMVPRTQMDCVSDSLTLPELISIVSKTKHSKLPVFKGTTDNVIGILNTRDLFDWWNNVLKVSEGCGSSVVASREFRLVQFLRKANFVPATTTASALLEDMRARKIQIVIVVDEFGGTSGLITLEDLLEQLVGEIWDEYDNHI